MVTGRAYQRRNMQRKTWMYLIIIGEVLKTHF